MKPRYEYITSSNYINDLSFDYIETYSLQRGADYEEKLKLFEAEYKQLQQKRYLLTAEGRRYKELNKIFAYQQYLIDADSKFHFSAVKTNVFMKNDARVDSLGQILRSDGKEVLNFLCAPDYRDAIVFYKSAGAIVSSLNVCLSCLYMETKMFTYVQAGYETYGLLKKWFIDIGHEVENPGYSITDEMEELKEKHAKQNKGKP